MERCPACPDSGPVNLDDSTTWSALDSQGMLAMAEDFPGQCREGLRIGEQSQLDESYARVPNAIVLVGMGGSAIGGDLFARIYEEVLPVPVQVVRDYALPSFVDEGTLVITCSYSGNTEEVLEAYDQAVARGCRVLSVTSGGQLEQRSLRTSAAVIKVPGGRPPRAAIGFMLMPLLMLAPRLGFVPDNAGDREETLGLLDQQAEAFHRSTPTPENPAKQVAHALHGRFPLIYATSPTMAPVAFRWRTQLNENAKVLAISHELPELNHNEVVGWELGLGTVQQPAVFFLQRPDDYERIKARVDITKQLIGNRAPVHIESGLGRSLMAQVVTAMYLGDIASIYLAFLNGVDPYVISSIDLLKQRLAQIG